MARSDAMGIKSTVFTKPTGDGVWSGAHQASPRPAGGDHRGGREGHVHRPSRQKPLDQLRKVLIASPQAVRYFFVNAAVDEDV